MSNESKWWDSNLAELIGIAAVILAVLLGIGGCVHLAEKGLAKTEQAQ